MSCYLKNANDTTVSIPRFFESLTSVVYYELKICVKEVQWCIQKRYSDFDDLNKQLIEEHGIPKKMLPPKKLVGNKNTIFIEQRRKQLEVYVQNLLGIFRITMPRSFVVFLGFNKYDIVYLLQDLAKSICKTSTENENTKKKEFSLSAIELFAICERMYIPCCPLVENDQFNFSHVLDFCNNLNVLKITPVKDCPEASGNEFNVVDVPIEKSNIIPKNLFFNLNAFKYLKKLDVNGLSTENINDITSIKATLECICVHNTCITQINQVLLCDNVHKEIHRDLSCYGVWDKLLSIDLTRNLLTTIDTSICLAPNLQILILNENRLKDINNLNTLPGLRELSVANNLLTDCFDWHLKLGNIVLLNLAQNKLRELAGLRRMYSLVYLDLSCNLIDELNEVDYVARLPLLENLRLIGNPIGGCVDYRQRVFARFNNRSDQILLDNEKASQKELDLALVLSALHHSNGS